MLRFRLEKGDKQTVFITTNMSVLSSIDGQVGPKSRQPALINEIAFQVEEATPEGDFRVSFVVTKAAPGQADGMNEAAFAQLNEAIGVMTGLQGSHRFNSRGFVADVQLDVPPSAPTFCFWATERDGPWHAGVPPSEELLDAPLGRLHLLVDNPEAYADWASEYYERPVSAEAVRLFHQLVPLDEPMLRHLDNTLQLEDIAENMNEIGYPLR